MSRFNETNYRISGELNDVEQYCVCGLSFEEVDKYFMLREELSPVFFSEYNESVSKLTKLLVKSEDKEKYKKKTYKDVFFLLLDYFQESGLISYALLPPGREVCIRFTAAQKSLEDSEQASWKLK